MADIKNKKISVIGAERSGIAAALLAKKKGAAPFVSDYGSPEKIKEGTALLDKEGIAWEADGHSEKVFDCDFIVTSPGVPSDSEVLKTASEKRIPVISEVEFAFKFSKGNVIAITGTNGKTTTVSLCHHLFRLAGKNTFLGGNIGVSFSSIVDDAGYDDFTVLEISSFQLDHIQNFKPAVSAILNITPDHLNRYNNSYGEYISSKLRIFENQGTGGFYVYNADDRILEENLDKVNGDVAQYGFSLKGKLEKGAYLENNTLYFRDKGISEEIISADEMSLKGEHNIANSLAVIAIAKIYDITNAVIKEALSSFPGVEHRLEFVREINGVKFVNDSKATNINSVWYALRSFSEPLYLILGGKDKGNDYNDIKEPVLEHCKKVYAVGESREKVYNFFKDLLPVEKFETMEECVRAGLRDAEEGSTVLLSPACASFDMYKSYEHRGRDFKEIVGKL